MKILITGSAGFIGSYVARALVWRGDDVVGMDNFHDYYPRKCKEFNVDITNLAAGKDVQYFPNSIVQPIFKKIDSYYAGKKVAQKGSYTFVEGDIINYDFLKKLFSEFHFDAVVHLGAMAGVPLSIKEPRLYTAVNVDGTVNLLDLCKTYGVNKFVFASSATVYGDVGGRKVTEEDVIVKAVSPYGATKSAGEILCYSASAVYGLSIMVDRIFGPIYGPLQRPYGMLMQRAINFTYNNKQVQVYGRKGLESAKDSTYVDDQVDGILKLVDYDSRFEVFNIGTANPQSIQQWFGAIEKAMKKPVPYEIVEVDKGDVAASADISKANKLLGYNPTMTLDEGVSRQVEIFLEMPNWYRTMEKV